MGEQVKKEGMAAKAASPQLTRKNKLKSALRENLLRRKGKEKDDE